MVPTETLGTCEAHAIEEVAPLCECPARSCEPEVAIDTESVCEEDVVPVPHSPPCGVLDATACARGVKRKINDDDDGDGDVGCSGEIVDDEDDDDDDSVGSLADFIAPEDPDELDDPLVDLPDVDTGEVQCLFEGLESMRCDMSMLQEPVLNESGLRRSRRVPVKPSRFTEEFAADIAKTMLEDIPPEELDAALCVLSDDERYFETDDDGSDEDCIPSAEEDDDEDDEDVDDDDDDEEYEDDA
jgi:hypothetical protein